MEIAPVFHPKKSKYFVFTIDYLLPIIICLAVIMLGYFALYSPFFRINIVICTLDYQDCDNPAVLAELEKLKGQNIFTLSESSVSTRLTSGDFTIRAVEVSRTLPGNVAVSLQSVYPSVALQITGDPTWIVLDTQFRVIAARTASPNVPIVIVPGPLTVVVGQVIGDPLIKESLSLARRLADELFTIQSLTLVNDDTIVLILNDGKKAIFTPQKDELTQLRLLQRVLGGATISEDVSTIDVRFERPVLR